MVDLSVPGTHKTREFPERLTVLGEENCADLDDLRLMGEGATRDALYGTHFKIDYNVRTHKVSFLCAKHHAYYNFRENNLRKKSSRKVFQTESLYGFLRYIANYASSAVRLDGQRPFYGNFSPDRERQSVR